MNMLPVTSTLITNAGYEPDTKTMAVQFKNGGTVYHYAGVPENIYKEFQSASSQGSYFLQNIKNKYPTTKMG